MTEELKVKVKLDTSELKHGVKQIKQTLKETTSEFSGIDKATKNTTASTKGATVAIAAMGATTVAQTAIMAKSMNLAAESTKKVRHAVKQVQFDIKAYADIIKYADILGDGFTLKDKFKLGRFMFRDVNKDLKDVGKAIKDNLKVAFDKAKANIIAGAKHIRAALLGIVAAISATVLGFNHLSESTKQFRQAMNQVNTSFVALGSNSKIATATYESFYRILGDVQRSTEAANLLAQITTNEKELVEWTKIATGALAMLPDSLPTESLIEASNETIKTAKVVGALADALNWPADGANKISKALEGSAKAQQIFNKNIREGATVEDAFNAVLAETNSETQREVILRASLNSLYAESAGLYEEINREIIAQNEAQNRLNQAMAKLGSITQPLNTAFTNFKATLAEALAPAIKIVCDWLVTLINWLTTAAAWLGAFLSVLFPGIADKLSSAFKGVSTSINSATGGTGGLNEGLEKAEGTAQKLRRTLMGFDELNVVSSMSSSSGGSSAGAGGVSGGGAGIDVSGLTTGDSVFKKAQEQMEDFKKKIQDFMDKWGTQIKIIAAALAALGLAKILTDLGKAIGLGNGFLNIMNTIKKLAVSAITIVLQYELVNEFMDKYINGEGFKNYILGILTAAVGTGVLYSMWGPAGAVIGLGVTAVASLKAIIDNGGITNTESAIVALTALATAIGAIKIAWDKLGLSKIVASFGTFFTALKAGTGVVEALKNAFPALAGVIDKIAPVATAMGNAVKTILTGLKTFISNTWTAIYGLISNGLKTLGTFISNSWKTIATLITTGLTTLKSGITAALTAIKTAVSTVINFIIANPIAAIIAAVVALVALIAVKGDEIQKALNKVSQWISSVFVRDWRTIFGSTLGTIMNGFVKIVGDVLTNVQKVLNGIIDFIRGVFTGNWERAWNGVKEIFSGIFGGLTAIAKAPINGIITLINGLLSAVTSGLNAIKKQLNKISIDIPDWVPKYGGESFGFNFKTSSAPKIPLLAKGGIVTRSTLANIGEAGREAVLPLENNTGWMDALADRLAARMNPATKVILKVDERELGHATIHAINQNTKQTGGLQLL